MLEQLCNKRIPCKVIVRRPLDNLYGKRVEQIIINSIEATSDWSDALNGVDVVIHLAARAHIMKDDATDALSEYSKVNTEGTLQLAQQAANHGVKHFIFLSSVKVYGESTTESSPYSEDSELLTDDPYGISKKKAEIGLKQLAAQTAMEVVIIQPPLVYGEGVKVNFLSLIKLADTPLPLPFLTIHNHRSMIYLGNLVNFIVHSMNHPLAGNNTFLVSDGDDVSLARLLGILRDKQGRQRRLFPVPKLLFLLLGHLIGKPGVVDRLVGDLQVDISKARQLLDWQPPFTVEGGLAQTVQSYKKGKL